MNKGLKNYTKQIKKSLDASGDIYVNVCKQDANVHAIIPLLSSVGPVPIETSLIFNYQNRNDTGIFGTNTTHCKKDMISKCLMHSM